MFRVPAAGRGPPKAGTSDLIRRVDSRGGVLWPPSPTFHRRPRRWDRDRISLDGWRADRCGASGCSTVSAEPSIGPADRTGEQRDQNEARASSGENSADGRGRGSCQVDRARAPSMGGLPFFGSTVRTGRDARPGPGAAVVTSGRRGGRAGPAPRLRTNRPDRSLAVHGGGRRPPCRLVTAAGVRSRRRRGGGALTMMVRLVVA
jgi:hypothetical protein